MPEVDNATTLQQLLGAIKDISSCKAPGSDGFWSDWQIWPLQDPVSYRLPSVALQSFFFWSLSTTTCTVLFELMQHVWGIQYSQQSQTRLCAGSQPSLEFSSQCSSKMPLEQQMPAFLSVPALMANFSILPDSDGKPKSAKFSSETFCLPMMQLWLVKVTTISITSSMAFWMPVMTSAWPQPPASKKPKSRLRVLAFPHLSSSRTMHLKWSTALSTLVVLSLAPPFWTPEKERGLDSLQPTCLSFRNILEKPEAPKSHQNGCLQSLHHQCAESPGRTALRTVLS